jgi:hypothetical protein
MRDLIPHGIIDRMDRMDPDSLRDYNPSPTNSYAGTNAAWEPATRLVVVPERAAIPYGLSDNNPVRWTSP